MLRTMALCQAEENSSAIALRGVAGAGKTVLLRRIAYDLATKYGHLVLFASPGAILRPEPLQELYELTGLRVVLAVDHVADQISALTVLLDALDRTSVPITVVVTDTHAALGNSLEALGDRLKFSAGLHNLHDSEVDALLILLERHGALGLLAAEPRQRRKEIFIELADKQLLVALYEATQGRPLEDILLEEYNRVLLTEAQELYLLVCTLNRFRVPVRASLVHRVQRNQLQRL